MAINNIPNLFQSTVPGTASMPITYDSTPSLFNIDQAQVQQAINQNNQNKINEEQQQRKRADQSMKLQQFADTMRMINANKSGNVGAAKIFSDRIAQRKLLTEQKQKEAEEKAKIEAFLATPEGAPYKTMYTLAGPKGVISAFASNRGQAYKPDLKTYKNVTKEDIKIGNIILKPNESRPFNISNPTIANALMNASGIDEVSKGTVYTRQGGLYDTPDGVYQTMFIGGERYFDGPPVTLPNGEVKTRLTTDEFYSFYDSDEVSTTTSAEGYRYNLDKPNFDKLNKELLTTEKSFEQLERYWSNVKDSNIGLQRLGDQISQWYKTLLDTSNLTYEELARGVASGQLQRLIGANRIDTVGGGVMTEKDAWRVIEGLGGDVTALQNPEIVAEQLKEMYYIKSLDYNRGVKSYNNEIDTGNFSGYNKKSPVDKSSIENKFSLLPDGVPPGSVKKTNTNGVVYYEDPTTGKKYIVE